MSVNKYDLAFLLVAGGISAARGRERSLRRRRRRRRRRGRGQDPRAPPRGRGRRLHHSLQVEQRLTSRPRVVFRKHFLMEGSDFRGGQSSIGLFDRRGRQLVSVVAPGRVNYAIHVTWGPVTSWMKSYNFSNQFSDFSPRFYLIQWVKRTKE